MLILVLGSGQITTLQKVTLHAHKIIIIKHVGSMIYENVPDLVSRFVIAVLCMKGELNGACIGMNKIVLHA